jgi:hypothetical protein
MTKFVTIAPEKLSGAIQGVVKTSGKLQDTIHRIALSVCFTLHNRGANYGPEAAEHVNNLVNASPYHGRALATWFKDCTPFIWNDEAKAFVAPKDKMMGKDWMAVRDGKAFYEHSPAPKAQPYDVYASMEQWLGAALRHSAKPKDGDVVDAAFVRAIRGAVEEYKLAAQAAA